MSVPLHTALAEETRLVERWDTEATMHSKSIVVSDWPSGYAQYTVSKTDEQLILPLKAFIRKGAQDASSLKDELRNLI
jgi:hypothetical protein